MTETMTATMTGIMTTIEITKREILMLRVQLRNRRHFCRLAPRC